MTQDPKVPYSLAASLVARAAGVSGTLQAVSLGASPIEALEGMMLAVETAAMAHLATGAVTAEEIEALRIKIVQWGRERAEEMEKDGTADKIRQAKAAALAELNAASATGGGGSGDPNVN
jgi:hypothetical protein